MSEIKHSQKRLEILSKITQSFFSEVNLHSNYSVNLKLRSTNLVNLLINLSNVTRNFETLLVQYFTQVYESIYSGMFCC